MNPYLPISIEFGPLAILRMVEVIPEARWDAKNDPDRFSLREALAHCADWEPIWLERFQLVLQQPGATIKVYDEGQFAIDGKYFERNALSEAKRFVEGRKPLAALVRSLTPEQCAIKFNHPERGELTVGDFANMIVAHDMYHVEQVSQYLGERVAGTW